MTTLFFVSAKEPKTVFLAAALSPFLALAVLVESNRSHHYNMTELESATKLSLRSVVLCRLLILGVFDLLVLVFVVAMTQLRTGYGLLLTGAYILLPYLFTMWAGLQAERSRFGREMPYATVGISIVISVTVFFLASDNSKTFNPVYGVWWEVATIILMIAVAISVKNKVRLLEEPVWS